jgi:hypothetical protein
MVLLLKLMFIQLEILFQELLVGESEEGEVVGLSELCPASRVAITSHALAALAGSMERNHVHNVSTKVAAATTQFINQLFRYLSIYTILFIS